jgi:hypothetical protein
LIADCPARQKKGSDQGDSQASGSGDESSGEPSTPEGETTTDKKNGSGAE